MSIELPYMAVLWDGNRNADLGSSMKTFNLDKFGVTKTATYGSSMDTFAYNRKVSIELLRTAVL